MDEEPTTPKTYAERIDPESELKKQLDFFNSPVGRLLARFTNTRNDVVELTARYEALISAPDRIAEALGERGWTVAESTNLEAYAAAAELAEAGRPDEADALLIAHWNDDPKLLEWPIHRLVGLYGSSEERLAIREDRQRLLHQALEHHRSENFAASILIVLTQMDGVFMDFTGKHAREFFHPSNPELQDEETLAGHPAGLRALSNIMSRGMKVTASSGKLQRHAILHGRELGYDTLANSTKAWAALFAIIDGLGPRANRLNRQLAEQREAQLAGSTERDDDGRRLDRRGFDEAKKLLWDLHVAQATHFKAHGRYTDDAQKLQRLFSGFHSSAAIEIRINNDGADYWAWVETPPGVVFGLGVRGEAPPVWQFSEGKTPEGGMGDDPGWRNSMEDPAPLEW